MIVGASSYGSDAKPFTVFYGKPGEITTSRAPWSCGGGPAELESSGKDVWVHCGDPHSPTAKPRVHFFHSGDGGRTWKKRGGFQGAVALGAYAVGGSQLFVNGSFQGKAWTLSSVKDAPSWSGGAQLAASPDGSQLVLVGKDGTDVAVAHSTDGGKTLTEVARRKIGELVPRVDSVSFSSNTVSFIAEKDGAIVSVGSYEIGDDEMRMNALDNPAEDACTNGPRVAVRWSGAEISVSNAVGVAYLALPPPPAPPTGPSVVLRCMDNGVGFGEYRTPWPSG